MPAPRVPAVVMMHGRAGAYSSAADGRYDASTLSRRHRMWGELWARQGYLAILVDGFGPRGYPQGFPRFSYGRRPPEVDEVAVRPLDAYGALAYLRTRADVVPDRIGLQGWSNGGSATLSAMAGTGISARRRRPASAPPSPSIRPAASRAASRTATVPTRRSVCSMAPTTRRYPRAGAMRSWRNRGRRAAIFGSTSTTAPRTASTIRAASDGASPTTPLPPQTPWRGRRASSRGSWQKGSPPRPPRRAGSTWCISCVSSSKPGEPA